MIPLCPLLAMCFWWAFWGIGEIEHQDVHRLIGLELCCKDDSRGMHVAVAGL